MRVGKALSALVWLIPALFVISANGKVRVRLAGQGHIVSALWITTSTAQGPLASSIKGVISTSAKGREDDGLNSEPVGRAKGSCGTLSASVLALAQNSKAPDALFCLELSAVRS